MTRGRAQAAVLSVLAVVTAATGAVTTSPPAGAAGKPTCHGRVATIVAKKSGRLQGTSGPDVIVGSSGDDRIKGKGGDDVVCGLGGKDKISGGPGADDLDGGAAKDDVNGGPGDDVCVAEPGHDKLTSCNEPVTPPPPPPPADQPPTAVADSATVVEDAAATAVNVLANDTDPDGGTKAIASTTQPAHGTVAITGGGTGLTYKPAANYCNGGSPTDTFTYTLAPGGSSATVSMTVTCVDDPPLAVNDAATVLEDAAATAISVLPNDTDPDGGTAKSIASTTQPAHGTVAITGGGTGLTYKPAANYCNGGNPLDTFTYTLAPGGSTATVSMTVTCVDDPPVAVNDAATVAQDAAATAISVLANDTDIDGGTKTIVSTTQPAHGTVALTGGGTGLTYKPIAGYCNSDGYPVDTFAYTLSPGGSTATVSITVTCPSTVPSAPISYSPNTAFHVQDTGIDYWASVPSSYDATHHTPMTLFVWLHGCGGQSQFEAENLAHGTSGQDWITLAVGGRDGACWQPGTDDAKVLAAIASVKTHFNIARRSVVIGGYSSGCDLCYHVAFLHPTSFAGLLAVNSSPFYGSNVSQAQVTAAAATPFHIVQLAHLHDQVYDITRVRTETATVRAAGFDLSLIEREGTHYDQAGDVVNGQPVSGTYEDVYTYLLPHLDDGWRSAN